MQREYPKVPRDPKALLKALIEINQLSYFNRGNLSVLELERRLKEVYEASHYAIAVPVDYEEPRPETALHTHSGKDQGHK